MVVVESLVFEEHHQKRIHLIVEVARNHQKRIHLVVGVERNQQKRIHLIVVVEGLLVGIEVEGSY